MEQVTEYSHIVQFLLHILQMSLSSLVEISALKTRKYFFKSYNALLWLRTHIKWI